MDGSILAETQDVGLEEFNTQENDDKHHKPANVGCEISTNQNDYWVHQDLYDLGPPITKKWAPLA